MAITCDEIKGSTNFRMKKKYPEIFEYLGWCSWEAYHREVSEELILETIKDYSSSGLPVKYILPQMRLGKYRKVGLLSIEKIALEMFF